MNQADAIESWEIRKTTVEGVTVRTWQNTDCPLPHETLITQGSQQYVIGNYARPAEADVAHDVICELLAQGIGIEAAWEKFYQTDYLTPRLMHVGDGHLVKKS